MNALLRAGVSFIGGLLGLLAVIMLGSAMGWMEPLNGKGSVVLILGGLVLFVGAAVFCVSQGLGRRPGAALQPHPLAELLFGAVAGVVLIPLYVLTEMALPQGTSAALVLAGIGSYVVAWAIRASLSKAFGRPRIEAA